MNPADRIRSAWKTLRRGSGRRRETPQPTSRRAVDQRLTGVVERVNRRSCSGWISVPADLPPTPVSLHVGPVRISSTFPTPDDRRNSAQQIRTFSFKIEGLWDYLGKQNRLSVSFEGQSLPIAGHGTYLKPRSAGKFRPADLAARVDEGFVLTQSGRLALSKRMDTAWQSSVMSIYDTVNKVVREKFGYESFIMYGTLLGAVREGGYISHDADFDAAYISRMSTGPEAAEELTEIALELLAAGFVVDLRHRVLHVHDPHDTRLRIDLFHLFFDGEDVLRTAWGFAGTSTLTRDEWQGTERIAFPGGEVSVPVIGERMVAHIYGEQWRLPSPGFNWTTSRTDVSDDAVLTQTQRNRVYWANFYARNSYASGSTFFEFVAARDDLPDTVIDIGCGDGRDSRAFGASGCRVIGLDRSEVGIKHASDGALEAGLERVDFMVCDVSEATAARSILTDVVASSEGPVAFYLRFFLHAIHGDVQDTLMETLSECSRSGDVFAAEFRTDKDETKDKAHGNHYRRFQNAIAFKQDLESRWGFDVLYEIEDTGMSPYRGEDPVLYRVIARRR